MTYHSDYFPESRPTGWLSEHQRNGMPNQHSQLINNNWKR